MNKSSALESGGFATISSTGFRRPAWAEPSRDGSYLYVKYLWHGRSLDDVFVLMASADGLSMII
jgi:hypothetical protein